LLTERRECIQSCPCKCNTICVDSCKEIGLETVCESSCGCNRPTPTEETTSDETHKDSEEVESKKGNTQAEDEEEHDEHEKEDHEQEKEHDEDDDKEAVQNTIDIAQVKTIEQVEHQIITQLISENSPENELKSEETLESAAIKTTVTDSDTPFEVLVENMLGGGEECKPT